MPTYEYKCNRCKIECEVKQGFDDEPLEICPSCNKKALVKVISGGLGFFSTNRTVGIVSDKNTDKFSDDFKSHLKEKNQTQKVDKLSKKLKNAQIQQKPKDTKKPWYKHNQTVSDDTLRKATPQQKENYIKKGKLDG